MRSSPPPADLARGFVDGRASLHPDRCIHRRAVPRQPGGCDRPGGPGRRCMDAVGGPGDEPFGDGVLSPVGRRGRGVGPPLVHTYDRGGPVRPRHPGYGTCPRQRTRRDRRDGVSHEVRPPRRRGRGRRRPIGLSSRRGDPRAGHPGDGDRPGPTGGGCRTGTQRSGGRASVGFGCPILHSGHGPPRRAGGSGRDHHRCGGGRGCGRGGVTGLRSERRNP